MCRPVVRIDPCCSVISVSSVSHTGLNVNQYVTVFMNQIT
jgi:hypothetical protein